MSVVDTLSDIKRRVGEELQALDGSAALENLRVRVLGKKGELTALLKQMGKLLDSLEDNDDVQNVWHSLENEEDLPE